MGNLLVRLLRRIKIYLAAPKSHTIAEIPVSHAHGVNAIDDEINNPQKQRSIVLFGQSLFLHSLLIMLNDRKEIEIRSPNLRFKLDTFIFIPGINHFGIAQNCPFYNER